MLHPGRRYDERAFPVLALRSTQACSSRTHLCSRLSRCGAAEVKFGIKLARIRMHRPRSNPERLSYSSYKTTPFTRGFPGLQIFWRSRSSGLAPRPPIPISIFPLIRRSITPHALAPFCRLRCSAQCRSSPFHCRGGKGLFLPREKRWGP